MGLANNNIYDQNVEKETLKNTNMEKSNLIYQKNISEKTHLHPNIKNEVKNNGIIKSGEDNLIWRNWNQTIKAVPNSRIGRR